MGLLTTHPVGAGPPTLVSVSGSNEEAALTEGAVSTSDETAVDAVLLFVGGPLDGRVEIRAGRHGDPLPVVTHVHLHGGPKVVHRYDLEPLAEGVGVYTLRPPAQRCARDGVEAD